MEIIKNLKSQLSFNVQVISKKIYPSTQTTASPNSISPKVKEILQFPKKTGQAVPPSGCREKKSHFLTDKKMGL
jgi:hypothetical protein